MDDHVLPPKSIAKTQIQKKNKALGYETRFLLLGHSQLMIARDPEFTNIVNILPLEGGYVMVKKPRDFGGLVLSTHQRDYVLKFDSPDDLVLWYHKLQQVVSKELQVDPYAVRKREQDEKVSNLNLYTQYKKIVVDIEDKLGELKKFGNAKRKFEKEHMADEDLVEYIDSVNEQSTLPQLVNQVMQILVPTTDKNATQDQSRATKSHL